MNGSLRWIAAAAAVILIAVVGFAVLGRPSDSGVGTPSSPSPSRSPVASPRPTPAKGMPAGTYSFTKAHPNVSYALPAGWVLTDDWAGGFALRPADSPEMDGLHVWYDVAVAAADCTEAPEPGIGHTATDFATMWSTRPGLVASQPQPISVGGLDGLMADLAMEPSWTGTCPFSSGQAVVPILIGDQVASDGVHWTVAGSERFHAIALDVGDGRTIVIEVDSEDGKTFDSLVSQAMPIIESFEFTP